MATPSGLGAHARFAIVQLAFVRPGQGGSGATVTEDGRRRVRLVELAVVGRSLVLVRRLECQLGQSKTRAWVPRSGKWPRQPARR